MLETILLVGFSVLGTVLVLGAGFFLYGRRQLAHLRGALASMHADLGAGAGAAAPPATTYATLEDDEVSAPKRALPVLATACSTCRSWSHAMGQRHLQAAPAFLAASQWIQPWQMAQKRSPEWIAAETELSTAQLELRSAEKAGMDVGDHLQARVAELSAKLKSLPEYLPMEKQEQMMKLTLDDFGLCTSRQELRAKVDTCDRYVAQVEA
jgi:hypothetical protein